MDHKLYSFYTSLQNYVSQISQFSNIWIFQIANFRPRFKNTLKYLSHFIQQQIFDHFQKYFKITIHNSYNLQKRQTRFILYVWVYQLYIFILLCIISSQNVQVSTTITIKQTQHANTPVYRKSNIIYMIKLCSTVKINSNFRINTIIPHNSKPIKQIGQIDVFVLNSSTNKFHQIFIKQMILTKRFNLLGIFQYKKHNNVSNDSNKISILVQNKISQKDTRVYCFNIYAYIFHDNAFNLNISNIMFLERVTICNILIYDYA
eukprot:TRINITY_DN2148_c0_g1_i4.p1 TRINITY_DN2148_c0_g1~~TRINITY_DN2148_c0_g1_i4.p1  ORF type:complete len:261 (+),score=-35.88 TRINITY_DN2148_c0_g1_i4:89-871(+)